MAITIEGWSSTLRRVRREGRLTCRSRSRAEARLGARDCGGTPRRVRGLPRRRVEPLAAAARLPPSGARPRARPGRRLRRCVEPALEPRRRRDQLRAVPAAGAVARARRSCSSRSRPGAAEVRDRPGAARRGRRRGGRDDDPARARRPRGRDLPRGHAAREGLAQDAARGGRTPARRASRSPPACRSFPRRSRAPSG